MFAKLVITVLVLTSQVYAAAIAPLYQYELGLNSTAYQQKFNDLLKLGYRLTYISGYRDEHNETLFSGVWKKSSSSVPWVARHGLTGAAYDALSAQLKAQKYRPVVLNAYNLQNGEPRFATIWEKPSSAVTWLQQRDLTEAQLKAKISAQLPLRVTTLTRYTVGDEFRFAATWGKRTVEDWHGDWYQSLGKPSMETGPPADGFKAISMNVVSANGEPMYDSVWQRYTSPGWDKVVTYDQTWGDRKSFESGYKYMAGKGFGPRVLTGYYVKDCGMQYVGTFEKDS